MAFSIYDRNFQDAVAANVKWHYGNRADFIQPTKHGIEAHALTVTFANMSIATVPKAAFVKLSRCKTLNFINTKTTRIDPDAWIGLSHLESLSIEESSMVTLEADMFEHFKITDEAKSNKRLY